jgi:hypothetical protein
MSATAFSVWNAADTTLHWASQSQIGTEIEGCGLVKSGSSGQIMWTGSPTNGCEFFSFNDSLQATAPVYFRIDYTLQGMGFITNYRFTISTGASGITNEGQVMGLPTFLSGQQDQTEISNCFISGDTNRLQLALFEGPNVFPYYFINIERTKDSSGNDTADGIIIQATCGTDVGNFAPNTPLSGLVSCMLPFTGTVGGFQPVWNSAFNLNSNSLNNASKVGTLQVIPFNFIPYNPGLGTLLYYGSDFPAYSPVSIPVYGSSHTYLPLQNFHSGFGVVNTSNPALGAYGNPATHIMMRYE